MEPTINVPLILSWQLDPVLLGSLLALAVGYALAVGPLRRRLAPDAPFPAVKATWYYGALLFIYLLEGSPLHDLADTYLFSAHMAQHLALSYLAAPMLLFGLPPWLLRALLLHPAVAPIARTLTRPVVAFFAFTLFFSVWHIPAVYEGALRNDTLHHSEHLLFLLSSLLLWWPLMSPLPELPRPGYPIRMAYLFLLPVAQIPVFAAVTFAGEVLYPSYLATSGALGVSALDDQRLGGILMKVIGLFVFGIPLAVTFFRWYAAEAGPRPAPTGDPARTS